MKCMLNYEMPLLAEILTQLGSFDLMKALDVAIQGRNQGYGSGLVSNSLPGLDNSQIQPTKHDTTGT